MRDKVNLAEAFTRFEETWSPRIVAALNGQHVRVAKLEGAFDWHRHDAEDELFLVVAGRLTIQLRGVDRDAVDLEAGELFVVPRGVEHRPVADGVAHVVLFEPASTLNTGTERTARTVDDPAWL